VKKSVKKGNASIVERVSFSMIILGRPMVTLFPWISKQAKGITVSNTVERRYSVKRKAVPELISSKILKRIPQLLNKGLSITEINIIV